MNSQEADKQKIAAELKQAQAQLAEFEAPQKSFTADARTKYARQINRLKQKVNAKTTQLKRRCEADKDVWDLVRYCF